MTRFAELPLAQRLSIVRSGTAYFAQRLDGLADNDFREPCALPDWTRAHLIAHLGYNATALGRLLDWAVTGVETPMYSSAEGRAAEIAEGAELEPGTLRESFGRAAQVLDERLSAATDSVWSAQVRTAQGRLVRADEILWMRSREVWIHAVDLADGARFEDFPDAVLDSLLTDITDVWHRRGDGAGVLLAADGLAAISVQPETAVTTTVSGPLATIVRWAAGRGADDIHIDGPQTTPPVWL